MTANDVRLAGAIMHHPSRPHLPVRLLGALSDSERVRRIRVVTDPVPLLSVKDVSPWRTYRLCLEQAPPDCSHYLILQDDALPCPGFLDVAALAISHRPNEVISFFINFLAHASATKLVQTATLCSAWSELDPQERFLPTVATVYPRELVDDLATFHTDQVNPIADDEITGRWRRERGHRVWITIPNLVQHDEEEASVLLGHRDSRPRWSACFIGEHSPDLIDWTKGLT